MHEVTCMHTIAHIFLVPMRKSSNSLMVLGDKSTLGFSLQDAPSVLTDMPEEKFQSMITKTMGRLVMRPTAKPENARLVNAVREIGDLQEVAKDLLSALNTGYLGTACRIASASEPSSLLYETGTRSPECCGQGCL